MTDRGSGKVIRHPAERCSEGCTGWCRIACGSSMWQPKQEGHVRCDELADCRGNNNAGPVEREFSFGLCPLCMCRVSLVVVVFSIIIPHQLCSLVVIVTVHCGGGGCICPCISVCKCKTHPLVNVVLFGFPLSFT